MSRLPPHIVVNATPVQTTTSAQVVVTSWTPASHSPAVNNCIVYARGILIGRSSTDELIVHEISTAFKIVSGTVTQIGTQNLHMATMGNGGISSSSFISTASNVINFRVDGVSGKTINWTGWLTIDTSEV